MAFHKSDAEAGRIVERIGDIQRDIAGQRSARLPIDKAFFDELSGDTDIEAA